MILLLGGTSEAAPLSAALAAAGHTVLVSTATEAPLELPGPPSVSRRYGRLDGAAMTALLRECGARALVDATHPYAAEAHRHAQEAAHAAGIPCLRWLRAATDLARFEDVIHASSHDQAARMAFSLGRPVLLTIGSRNLTPYLREAVRTGLPVVARVLPLAESLEACHRAGLPQARIIAARGPFSVEANRKAIRDAGAGALVTKDSGAEGGVPGKIEAANLEGCHVVLVRRPPAGVPDTFQSVDLLLRALERLLPSREPRR
jgi:precorrin-6A/cobalt-precorrin-6A reductase